MDTLTLAIGYLIGLTITIVVARKLRIARKLGLRDSEDYATFGTLLLFWPIMLLCVTVASITKQLGRLATK